MSYHQRHTIRRAIVTMLLIAVFCPIAEVRAISSRNEKRFVKGELLLAREKAEVSQLEKKFQAIRRKRAQMEKEARIESLYKVGREYSQSEKEEEITEKKEKSLQAVRHKTEEIEKKTRIESLYKAGKECFENKDYDNAVYAFREILTLEPENKKALRYYKWCRKEIKREEITQLFENKQKQALLKKQERARLGKKAQEKAKISRVKSCYRQGKESLAKKDYLAAIAKFSQVIELEKSLSSSYTPYARKHIRQAREKIKEKAQMRVQSKKEEEITGKKEKEEKKFQVSRSKKAQIKEKARLESLYKAGKECFENKDYDNAVYAFGEILTFEPENKKALKYYEQCQQVMKMREITQLFENKKKQVLLKKQERARLEKKVQEKAKISRVKSCYRQGKESLAKKDYLTAIAKFNLVIELEKELYPTHTPYAWEHIQQAWEKIKEQERKQMWVQKEWEEKLARKKEEERLKTEAQEKERLFQAESAYKEAQEAFLEAKTKLETTAGLKKKLEIVSAARAKEVKEYPAQKKERLKKIEKEKEYVEEKKISVQKEKEPQVSEYTIDKEDVLGISVWEWKDLDLETIVRPDGKISFPLIGDLQAQGLTLTDLDRDITEKLKVYIRSPEVSVVLKKFGGKKVIVLGEVVNPGVYRASGKNTIMEIIALAGGFTDDAVSSSVILVRGDLEQPKAKRINLTRVFKKGDLANNISVQPEDIVYVPRKFIANINYFLKQLSPALEKANFYKGWEN